MNVQDAWNWSKIVFLRKNNAPQVSHIEIETSTKCNLNCIMCRLTERSEICQNQLLSYESARIIFDKIKSKRVTLCHNGEPFLNPEIFRIISYIHNKGSWTSITTNLNTIPGTAADLINSGLDVLKISIDAATLETYANIRKGGDFDLVINNIKLILREKNKRKSSTPFLRLGFVIQEENYNEIDLFTQMAITLGVEAVRFYPVTPMTAHQLPTKFDFDLLSRKISRAKRISKLSGLKTNLESISMEFFKTYQYINKNNYRLFYTIYNKLAKKEGQERRCLQPWLSSNVLIDGTVAPCCPLSPPDRSRVEMGNIFHQSWDNIWNGEQYWSFRRAVKNGEYLRCIDKCPEVKTIENLFVFLIKVLPCY